MPGLCRVGVTKRMGLFWALICVVNFAGTIQDSTTAVPEIIMTTGPMSSVTTPAEITMKETTSRSSPPTDNPTKVATSAASVSPSGTSTAELTTTKMNGSHPLTTEQGTVPPVTEEEATVNTTILGKNETDNALPFIATTETSSEDMDTTRQTTPPATMQPAAMTVSHGPINTVQTENVEVVVNCLPKKHPGAENTNCFKFRDPITCEQLKTKNDVAEFFCKSLHNTSPSGQCHLNLSPSETDPTCLQLHSDDSGTKIEVSENTMNMLKQHGVDLKTISIPESKPRTTLIALVTTGLVVAALILCGYFLSNRQSWSPGSRRLDEDYAGNDSPDNTLISVATRDQPGQLDKPNLKAGSQENGTGQTVTPAATNGHSNKQHIVADTEL